MESGSKAKLALCLSLPCYSCHRCPILSDHFLKPHCSHPIAIFTSWFPSSHSSPPTSTPPLLQAIPGSQSEPSKTDSCPFPAHNCKAQH